MTPAKVRWKLKPAHYTCRSIAAACRQRAEIQGCGQIAHLIGGFLRYQRVGYR
jgi:hypothetical protein